MPLAELHGKVPGPVRRSEDALTGAAFNLLTLLPPEGGLLPWLNLAQDSDGVGVGLPAVGRVESAFWPLWKDGSGRDCEPDVVLSIQTEDACTAVLIEVKYLSGLSGWPTPPEGGEVRGQLGREWEALDAVSGHELPGAPATISRRVIIFVTTDTQIPKETLDLSVAEIQAKMSGAKANIFWLSWFALADVVEARLHEEGVSSWELLGLARLLALLESRRLVVFSGIDTPIPPSVPWSYQSRYFEMVEPVVSPWSYSS